MKIDGNNHTIIACIPDNSFSFEGQSKRLSWEPETEMSWTVPLESDNDSNNSTEELRKLFDMPQRVICKITLEGKIGTPEYNQLLTYKNHKKFRLKIKGKQYARPMFVSMVRAEVEGSISNLKQQEKGDVIEFSATMIAAPEV